MPEDLSKNEMYKKAERKVSKFLLDYVRDLNVMYPHGIKGLAKKVKRAYINGNGETYEDDFLNFVQTDGVRYIIEQKKAIIADEMGVGKTAQAVAMKLELENRSEGEKIKCLAIVPNELKSMWKDRIAEYCERKQTVEVLDENAYGNMPDFLRRVRKKADFVIANYNVFGDRRRNGELTKKLKDIGFDYIILDEVHNTKNANAIRSSHIKELADSIPYCVLLSGTLIPNRLKDAYMVISLVDPEEYPTAAHVRAVHRHRPDIIKAVLGTRRLKRTMADVENMPPRKDNFGQLVTLSEDQMQVYNDIYQNDTFEGMPKLQLLRKALLDPSLIKPKDIYDPNLKAKLSSIESGKYRILDNIIKEKVEKGEKIVVFSSMFRKGVTEKLEKRYKNYGAVRIDGTVAYEKRKQARETFQHNPDKRVLIATTATTGEGLDLTAANNVVFLDDPYTPAQRDQAIARVYRRGQKRHVDVISIAVENTVDEGVVELLKWKKEGLMLFEEGERLSEEHMRVLSDEEHKTTPIYNRLYSPQQRVRYYSIQMKMLGSMRGHEKLERELNKNDGSIGKQYAESYTIGWDTSYSANTARVYKKIIDSISTFVETKRKVDLGSGPGILSHILNEPTVNVDINPKSFEQGFAHQKCKNIVSSFNDLKKDLADESFNLAVSSLSLDYTSNKKQENQKRTEREDSLREVNRILKKGGYFILTLPYTEMNSKSSEELDTALLKLGFEPVSELTGMVRSATEDVDFQTYISVSKKIKSPSKNEVSHLLNLSTPSKNKEYVMRKKGVVEDFVFVDGENKETIETRLEKLLEKKKHK